MSRLSPPSPPKKGNEKGKRKERKEKKYFVIERKRLQILVLEAKKNLKRVLGPQFLFPFVYLLFFYKFFPSSRWIHEYMQMRVWLFSILASGCPSSSFLLRIVLPPRGYRSLHDGGHDCADDEYPFSRTPPLPAWLIFHFRLWIRQVPRPRTWARCSSVPCI
jgi:hypothetical protein